MAANTAPFSTYKTYLMAKTGSPAAWSKLVDVTNISGLMEAPELLDTTTLSNSVRTGTPGLQALNPVTAQANYTHDIFNTLYSPTGSYAGKELEYAVWLGGTFSSTTSQVEPDGADGKFSFKAYLSATKDDMDVDSVQTFTITLARTTDITFE